MKPYQTTFSYQTVHKHWFCVHVGLQSLSRIDTNKDQFYMCICGAGWGHGCRNVYISLHALKITKTLWTPCNTNCKLVFPCSVVQITHTLICLILCSFYMLRCIYNIFFAFLVFNARFSLLYNQAKIFTDETK